jgi:DNA-binding transcriptional regulator GbsR (MarR family)
VSSTFAAPTDLDAAEELRRSFAAAWGEIGAAWGVAPSTATVQGYLLVSDGPLSEPEVRRALGMSHRAASLALQQCEEWGLVERATAPRRSGQRGPAATAWVVVDDHWEWFREEMTRLGERLDALLEFVGRFEHGVETFVRGDARAIEGLFAALAALEPATADRLWALLGALGPNDIGKALDSLSRLSPTAARRLVKLADQPVLQKLIGNR